MKVGLLTCAAAVALGGSLVGRAMAQDYAIPAGTPAYIRAAVESDTRPEADTARDADRKPAEILTLSGIKPGDRVIEIAGFGNYYTRMLAAIVGDNGKVSMFDLPYTGGRAGQASAAFVAEHANSEYHLVDYNDAVFPQDVDTVFMILYYHDLGLQEIDRAALNAKLFAALKPGGAFLVVDHKAEDGSGWRDTQQLHRVDVAEIVKEVTAAGFELEVDSDLLANPDDPRTQMVFTPGVRGHTDRAVFVFRKPE
jgi:predicted methyltransferase